MLNFVARHFRGVFGFFLWLNLILFAFVAPLVITTKLGGGDASIGVFVVCVIVGLPAGLLVNILLGGFITILLRIDKNLQILVKLRKGQPVEQGIEPTDA